jgi:hypothetical protein
MGAPGIRDLRILDVEPIMASEAQGNGYVEKGQSKAQLPGNLRH